VLRWRKYLWLVLGSLVAGLLAVLYVRVGTAPSDNPQIRFVGYTDDLGAEFELTNPSRNALQYLTLAGMLHWSMQFRNQGIWEGDYQFQGCYLSIGRQSLPAHSSIRFVMPTDNWPAILQMDETADFRAGVCVFPSSPRKHLSAPGAAGTKWGRLQKGIVDQWHRFEDWLFGSFHERHMVWSDAVAPHMEILRASRALEVASREAREPK
jgi:hypothetical protein